MKVLKKYEFIVTWLGLVLSLISLCSIKAKVDEINTYYNKSISNQISNNTYAQDIELLDSVVIGKDNTDVSIEIDKSVKAEVASMIYMGNSDNYYEDALKYAECYFSLGQYNAAFNIYYILNSDNQFEDYDMALIKNNLGFFYANGLGCENNFARAFELYDEAILLGCERAITNKLALTLRVRFKERAEIIGTELNKENMIIKAFILSTYTPNLQYTKEEYIDLFKSATYDEILRYLDEYIYEEKFVGLEKFTAAPTSDSLNRYEAVGTYNWYNDEQGLSGTIYEYNHYVRYCKNIDLLNEGLIYSFEINKR